MGPDRRANAILQLIVEAYIRHAQPVSSSAVLQNNPELDLSSATVRTVMADLESMGLLLQTHTSGGRVPTERGMRLYLDNLVDPKLRPWDRKSLDRAAAQCADANAFSRQLGLALAKLTGQMVVLAQPRFLGARLREVGLVRYGERRVLAYFVSPTGLVQQKLLTLDFDLSSLDLQEIQNYLNTRLRDRNLLEVRRLIAQELADTSAHRDRLVAQALRIGASLLPDVQLDVFVQGTSNLLDQPEFSDLRKLRGLLRVLEKKQTLLHLVARLLEHTGVKVMLGSEHDVPDAKDLACVGCAVHSGGTAVSVLGPSRMDYGRLVPLVQYAGQVYERFWEQL